MENTAATRSELSLVLSQVEEEKMKGEEMKKASELAKWSVEEMSLLQLQEMRSALEELSNTMVLPPSSYMNTMSTGLSCIYNSIELCTCFYLSYI
ncbi:hypothetical protein Bca4012_009102 [Brassica carinata]|uniref:Uncharacterized protein n=1 Tax=Brassica carinata TaxID=52824 RepID=A0A8X7V1Q4_BRACI|nr:hypothetical protein Bca52824_034388 [Brassica carinata]